MASNTLFVSNFPFTTSEDDLRNAFEEHGPIKSVRIIVDRETGRSRGFAFIELGDGVSSEEAIAAHNNCDFRGRRLVVSLARGRTGGGSGMEAGHSGRGGGASSAPLRSAVPLRHRMVIEWDDASGSYTASVPDLGVQTQAPTIEAVARRAEVLAHERAADSAVEDTNAAGGDSRPSARDA